MKLLTRFIWLYMALMLTSCSQSSSKVSNDELSGDFRLLLSKKTAITLANQRENGAVTDAVARVRQAADKFVSTEIEVPIPKDPGGGFTHEKNKENYSAAVSCATAYLLFDKQEYLNRTKDLLLAYAKLYPSLPLHPEKKNQGPGKLFWQVLNEEVALVHFAQAFDMIKSDISAEDSTLIAEDLIRSMAHFLSVDSRNTFDKIHNHAIWACAAVGMSGYVLGDSSLVNKALYGSELKSETGFFKQIDMLFSPDGYYSEGPYYQRYALMPLVLFAQAIEKNQPELKVFGYKDSTILEVIKTTIELTPKNCKFFPLNDAINAKDIHTPELGYALPLLYKFGGHDNRVLDIIQRKGNLILTDAVLDIDMSKAIPYERKTNFISDGPNGENGGIALLRSSDNGFTTLLKFGTHGMGHGHFDQLELLVYHGDDEVLTDYGAVRFLNIPQKEGGRYLPENDSWGQLTPAHNTLVVDQNSQFGGDTKTADRFHGELMHFQNTPNFKTVTALDSNSYEGCAIERTIQLIDDELLGELVIDVISVQSDEEHKYDLPFYYKGSFIETTQPIDFETTQISVLGDKNGYQHLWKLGSSESFNSFDFTWMTHHKLMTLHSTSNQPFEVVFTQLGANDPNQNLRKEQGLMYRSKSKQQTWVNLLEIHGQHDPVTEKTSGAYPNIKAIKILEQSSKALTLQLSLRSGEILTRTIEINPEKRD